MFFYDLYWRRFDALDFFIDETKIYMLVKMTKKDCQKRYLRNKPGYNILAENGIQIFVDDFDSFHCMLTISLSVNPFEKMKLDLIESKKYSLEAEKTCQECGHKHTIFDEIYRQGKDPEDRITYDNFIDEKGFRDKELKDLWRMQVKYLHDNIQIFESYISSIFGNDYLEEYYTKINTNLFTHINVGDPVKAIEERSSAFNYIFKEIRQPDTPIETDRILLGQGYSYPSHNAKYSVKKIGCRCSSSVVRRELKLEKLSLNQGSESVLESQFRDILWPLMKQFDWIEQAIKCKITAPPINVVSDKLSKTYDPHMTIEERISMKDTWPMLLKQPIKYNWNDRTSENKLNDLIRYGFAEKVIRGYAVISADYFYNGAKKAIVK